MKYIIGIDPGAPCPRCSRIHGVASTYDASGRLVSWERDQCRGWRARIARRLADALAAVSRLVGQ
jgi:hypothetical protein